jgi:hypothetical protein
MRGLETQNDGLVTGGDIRREGGGRYYSLEDLLCHQVDGDRYGFGDELLARVLAVPEAYLRAVREAAGLARASQEGPVP